MLEHVTPHFTGSRERNKRKGMSGNHGIVYSKTTKRSRSPLLPVPSATFLNGCILRVITRLIMIIKASMNELGYALLLFSIMDCCGLKRNLNQGHERP